MEAQSDAEQNADSSSSSSSDSDSTSDDGRKVISRRPAKKAKAKKAKKAKKATAKKAKKATAKKAKKATAKKAKKTEKVESAAEEKEAQKPAEEPTSEAKAPEASGEQQQETSSDSGRPDSRSDNGSSDSGDGYRSGRRRRRGGRRRRGSRGGGGGGRDEGGRQDSGRQDSGRQDSGRSDSRDRDQAHEKPQEDSWSLEEILTKDWSEDRARKYLREGVLMGLAAPLVSDAGDSLNVDADEIRKRLKVIRRILANECMVEDDASEVMMLDMVMNALADRIEVYRIQATSGDAEDMGRVLDLRYKADRRLIEAVDSLKKI